MVDYLKDVLGIKYLYRLPPSPEDQKIRSEDIQIEPGDWVWLGPNLDKLPIFTKIIEATSDYLKKKSFKGQMISIHLPYNQILESDYEWPEGVTFVCHDEDFYNMFSQVLPSETKIILIPDPSRYDQEPHLKKIAWQTLTKGVL
jgi:hypothetical protein